MERQEGKDWIDPSNLKVRNLRGDSELKGIRNPNRKSMDCKLYQATDLETKAQEMYEPSR